VVLIEIFGHPACTLFFVIAARMLQAVFLEGGRHPPSSSLPRRQAIPCLPPTRLPLMRKIAIYTPMEELFGDPAYKGFVLQDHKRLPSRFFARVSGALTCRLR
jgi:hypothetical protein